jgi:(2Fe-2S) ferredoxin
MSNFYKHHIFFCNNIRTNGKQCCSQNGAKELYHYAKDRCRENLMLGEGHFGVSESRCLGRCEHGPVAVVYPDDVWYQYIDEEDVDEIIESHLMGGKEVERLIIK